MERRRHEPLTRWALGKLLQWKPCGSWKPAPNSANFSKHARFSAKTTSGRSGPICLLQVLSHLELWRLLTLAWFVLEGFEGRLWVNLINQFRQVEIRNVFYLSWLSLLSKRFFAECLPCLLCWFQVEDSRSPSNAWEGLCASGQAQFFTSWQLLWYMEVPIEETTKKATSGLLHETSRRSMYVDKACNKAALFSTRFFFLHCFRFTF